MQNNDLFIQKIVVEKNPCFFISPHLDDAVLSAGDLISRLAGQTDVSVITIFTKPSPKPYTLSAKSYLRQCGFAGDADQCFSDRRSEDKEVFEKIGAKAIHLGFVDATWRKKQNISPFLKTIGHFAPELIHLYPVHQLNVAGGKIAKQDLPFINEAGEIINKIIVGKNKCRIFAPAGIGNHVDHVFTRKVCEIFFPNAILWSDFPYNLKISEANLAGYEKIQWNEDSGIKEQMINGYRTQVGAMFPKGIPEIPEIYYIPKDV